MCPNTRTLPEARSDCSFFIRLLRGFRVTADVAALVMMCFWIIGALPFSFWWVIFSFFSSQTVIFLMSQYFKISLFWR